MFRKFKKQKYPSIVYRAENDNKYRSKSQMIETVFSQLKISFRFESNIKHFCSVWLPLPGNTRRPVKARKKQRNVATGACHSAFNAAAATNASTDSAAAI